LALAALALVVFGAYDSYPLSIAWLEIVFMSYHLRRFYCISFPVLIVLSFSRIFKKKRIYGMVLSKPNIHLIQEGWHSIAPKTTSASP